MTLGVHVAEGVFHPVDNNGTTCNSSKWGCRAVAVVLSGGMAAGTIVGAHGLLTPAEKVEAFHIVGVIAR